MAVVVGAQQEHAAPPHEFTAPAYAEYFAGLITPEYANSLTAPTRDFLCPLKANIYDMDFTGFKVRALEEDGERVLLEMVKPTDLPPCSPRGDTARFLQYSFGPDFLNHKVLGATVWLSNGSYEAHGFRMIERHYFGDQLIRSFDFSLPFVPPNTTNTWEMIYEMPELSDEWKAALIAHPWETRSDSFYFVGEQLVMHHRAAYNYQ